jgi:hypothetical protein
MSLMNRPSVAGGATGAHQAALMPLLGTVKRLKRSLTPVRPSLAFQSALEGELLGVARRLATSRGNAPRIVVCGARPAEIRTRQAAAILGGLTAVSILVAICLLISRAGQERQRG